jgi:DNA-binding GntR family transcriptional regulator
VTIRVVLRSLADIGLLQIISHRGAFFSSLTPPKAWEIFSIRAPMSPTPRDSPSRSAHSPTT